MLGVIYRWRVNADLETEFVSAWAGQTQLLRDNVNGALGSMLLRATDEQEVYVGIARWSDEDAWRERRGATGLNDEFTTAMDRTATLLSVELLDEVDDDLA